MHQEKGPAGSVVLFVGRRELGHLHGDAVADVPLAPALQDQLVKDGVLQETQSRPDSRWVTIALETEDDVQQTLTLLRGNYDRAIANRDSHA